MAAQLMSASVWHTCKGTAYAPAATYSIDSVTDTWGPITLKDTLEAIGFAKQVVATGATAGTPGTWTPAGSAARANFASMSGCTASPATAWTTGQRVVMADGNPTYWNGTAWVAGQAP